MSDSAYSNEASATTLGIAKPLIKNSIVMASGTAAIGVQTVSGEANLLTSRMKADVYDIQVDLGATLHVRADNYDTKNVVGTLDLLPGDRSAGGGTPAGGTGDIQYNNAGAFAADAGNLSYDPTILPTGGQGAIKVHGVISSATGALNPYLQIGGDTKISGNGNMLNLFGGNTSAAGLDGGNVNIITGTGGVGGNAGRVRMWSGDSNTTNPVIFNTDALTSLDRTATFQDKDGTIAYLDDISSASAILENQVFGG